jgi:hypothetical protein
MVEQKDMIVKELGVARNDLLAAEIINIGSSDTADFDNEWT